MPACAGIRDDLQCGGLRQEWRSDRFLHPMRQGGHQLSMWQEHHQLPWSQRCALASTWDYLGVSRNAVFCTPAMAIESKGKWLMWLGKRDFLVKVKTDPRTTTSHWSFWVLNRTIPLLGYSCRHDPFPPESVLLWGCGWILWRARALSCIPSVAQGRRVRSSSWSVTPDNLSLMVHEHFVGPCSHSRLRLNHCHSITLQWCAHLHKWIFASSMTLYIYIYII